MRPNTDPQEENNNCRNKSGIVAELTNSSRSGYRTSRPVYGVSV